MKKSLLDFELRLLALRNLFGRVTVWVKKTFYKTPAGCLRHIFLLNLGLLLCSVTVNGQIIDLKNDKYWVDVGVGSYRSTYKLNAISMNFGANLIKDSMLYKIRFIRHIEWNFRGPNVLENVYNAGVMIGKRCWSSQNIQLMYSGGIGVIGGVERGEKLLSNIDGTSDYGKENFITPSIPLEINLIFKPKKYFGFGLAIFGELNHKRPMYGAIFKVGIGKLR